MAVSGFPFRLPRKTGKELLQDLARHHPSAMLPFAGEVDCGEEGLSHRLGRWLAGETLFFRDHFGSDGTGWRKPWMPYPKRKR